MFSRFACTLTVLAFAAGALAQGLPTINTPLSVVVCQPAQFTWTGGTAPFFLSMLPANQPGAAAILDFGRQDASPFTWTANLPPNTSFFLQLRDSTGAVAQSGTATIQAGSDTSCVGQTSSTTSTTGAGATTTTTGGATTTTPAGTTTTTPAGTTTRATTGTTTAAGTNTSTASGANQSNGATKFASSGALGLAGVAAIAALL